MDKNQKNCFVCNTNFKELLKLTCNHFICHKCICKEILKSYLTEIADKNSINIKCKCKNNNLTEITLVKLYDFLKLKNEVTIIKCNKHQAKSTKYCKECKLFLCDKCLTNHAELFTNHVLEDSSKNFNELINPNEGKCKKHSKEFSNYCKSCKISLCSYCVNDKKIMSGHKNHENISYKAFVDLAEKQNKKLQFGTYEAFNNYITKIEETFNKQFNENKNKTIKTLEEMTATIAKFIEEYKKSMDAKINKKNLIIYVIKKVYENYYNDFKVFNSGNHSINLIKYLSKPYIEFAEVSFISELDKVINKVNKLNNTIKNKNINDSIKIAYSYFSKKQLNLVTTIKDEFKDKINDIIELKDEKLIAASEDTTIKIFDKEGKTLTRLEGHIGGVRALCLLKNDRLASGAADRTLRIWCLKKNKEIKVIKDQTSAILALTLLSGDRLASCCFREILIYDEHFEIKYRLNEHQDCIRNFICLDKDRYASCSDDGILKIYDKHFRTIYNLKEHNECIFAVCYLRDGRIVSGDISGKMIIWSKNFSTIKEIKQHTEAVMHIIQLKDGRIVSCSADKTIIVWDLDFKNLFTYNEHSDSVIRLLSLKDGGFCSTGSDSLINIWR